MFGTEFKKIFDNKAGHPYSGFLDNIKLTRLFKEALILAIEEKYKTLETQKEYDELAAIIKTAATFTPSSNQINIKGSTTPIIRDYKHLLAVKSKYTVSTLLTVTDVSRTTPIVLTVSERNNLRTGERLTIVDVLGNINANGTYYVKKISNKRIALYTDKELTAGRPSSAQYVSGGSMSRIYYNWCKPYYSDRKIAVYGKPSLQHPKFEVADSKLKFYPDDETVQEITIDYITTAAVFVNPVNDTVNLEGTYPIKFLYHILNVATRLYAERFRDTEALQTSTLETQINP